MNVLLVTGAVVAATLYATPDPSPTVQLATQAAANHSHLWFPVVIGSLAVLYSLTTWSAVWKEAYRRKFDPTLALKYTDIFFTDIEEGRIAGTKVLIAYHENPRPWKDVLDRCEIDPILDTLDDLGFLLQGNQIHEWTVYQYFSYWIQLYYEASKGYIDLRRYENTTIYEHLQDLYDDMMVIEAHKRGRAKTELVFGDKLLSALKDEISMQPSSTPPAATSPSAPAS